MKDRMYFSGILSQLSTSLGAALQQTKTSDSSQLGQTGSQQSAPKPPEKISEPELQQNPLEAMRNLESVAEQERRLADDENTLDFTGRTDFHARLVTATDGRITLHLAGDIHIDGLTSTEAARAVEEHLRSQKLSSGKSIVEDRRLAAASSAQAMPAEREIARTQSEPAARHPATAVRSQAPPPAPRPGIRLPAFKPSIEPEAVSEPEAASASDTPWWLSDGTSGLPDASSSVPAAPAAAKPREPGMAPVKPRKEDVAAARMHEAEEAAITVRDTEIANARNLEAELRAVRMREAARLTEQMRRSQPMETPQASEPRLSGLRNVLFSLGLNNLNNVRVPETLQEPPQSPPQPLSPHRAQHRSEASVPAHPETSMPIVEHETPAETARVITAPPEFLAPQTESSRKDRHDRRDAYDEVEILPSWRGQYRRKG